LPESIFTLVMREASQRAARFEERQRARRAYHEASSLAMVDYLAELDRRILPTFNEHYAQSRARHGLS